jgi:integrase
MPSPRTPSLRRHKTHSLGVVTLNGHDHYLGPWPAGLRKPPDAVQAAYDRLIAEWLANGRQLQLARSAVDTSGPTVAELILAYYRHAEQHYRRPDGTPTSEVSEYRRAFVPLNHLHGDTPARAFGPLALKAVRQLMVNGYRHPKHGSQEPLARGVVNQRIARIRRAFKWGVEQELVPPSVLQTLQAVRGLQRGRSTARETEPVKPIAEAVVNATLPYCNQHVAAMIQVQLLTGMRPGEVCALRGCDLDITGPVWLYRPGSDQGIAGAHKTAHHGYHRVVAIGPRAQEVIRPFLKLDTHACFFSPREAMEEIRARRRQHRKTPMTPSQRKRKRTRNPKRTSGDRYSVGAYDHAIRAAVRAANKAAACDACKKLPPEEHCDACKARAVPHWHPHQLRHTKATEIRREAGLDAARAVLGHRTPAVTEVYAEIDVNKASEIMERLG